MSEKIFNFTTCGTSGNTGPTQNNINTNYANTTLDGLVTSNNGIQQFEIPKGVYEVVVKGAAGGDLTQYNTKGGLGAIVTSTLTFREPTLINVVVGQRGINDSAGTSGGGGSFVFTGEPGGEGLLIAAGGGGGCGHNYGHGADGSVDNSSRRGTSGRIYNGYSDYGDNGVGQGGKSDTPGLSWTYGRGGGGAGWYSSGDNGSDYSSGGKYLTFIGGYGNSNINGGFGGGGGAVGNGKSPGGGGGYTGGGSGLDYFGSNWGGAGGGGSFSVDENATFSVNTVCEHGLVTFTWIGESDPTWCPPVRNLSHKLEGRYLTLTWENPVENENFAGVKLIRNMSNFPVDDVDGEVLIETNDSNVNSYTEKIRFELDYYYSIYTFNADGEMKGCVKLHVSTHRTNLTFPKLITTCGKSGRIIPTQADANTSYSGTSLDGYIEVVEGKQIWIAPKKAEYTFTVCGAKGGAGNGNKSVASCLGGFGAKLQGTIKANENDKFEMLVGQRGTDNTGTGGDGTTGAGGGGTYLVYHPYNKDTQSYNDPILLIAAAGGNGGRDYGYSGDGAVYHGDASTPEVAPIIGTNPGGGYNTSSNDATTGGRSFLQGGAAATSTYTRGSSSDAGFGGGGANKDAGEGGGGGGYYGGHLTSSAYSYINEDLLYDVLRESGVNNGNGYIEINAEMITTGYFMRDSDNNLLYYDATEGIWTNLKSNFTVEMIEEFGIPILPFHLTKLVENGTIIKYKDNLDDKIEYSMTSLPLVNIITQLNDFDTTNKLIVGANLDCTNEVSVVVSCDKGETWMYFDGENWLEYQNDFIAMSVDDFSNLTKNIWKLLGYKTTNSVRLGFIINSSEYDPTNKINSFEFRTIQE